MEKGAKIFCIGLNKTGTTSLDHAFQILGLKSVHYVGKEGNIKKIIARNQEQGNPLLKGIEKYDAYSDWSYHTNLELFKEFDRLYPNSKFILTIRDLEGWLRSREKHVTRDPLHKKKLKKDPDNPWYKVDKEAWTKDYHEHHKNVLEYFKDRKQDLLVFDVTKGDGWDTLCPFLDMSVPEEPFPRANTAKRSDSRFWKTKKFLKSLVGRD
jgi:hypothetical protein